VLSPPTQRWLLLLLLLKTPRTYISTTLLVIGACEVHFLKHFLFIVANITSTTSPQVAVLPHQPSA